MTEYVRRKPFTLVLIDEIEKASKEFTQLFLQVLDEGRLTDGKGETVNFRNTVIIMTSNLGSAYLNDLPDDGKAVPAATKELVHGAIRAHFLPEFLNRISSIVLFNKLDRKGIRSIVTLRIAEVQQRLVDNGKAIKLDVSTEALDYLASIGYSPSYGARPLARAIQNELLSPLSRCILEESIRDGDTALVTWDAVQNRLLIHHLHEPTTMMEIDSDDEDIQIEEIDE